MPNLKEVIEERSEASQKATVQKPNETVTEEPEYKTHRYYELYCVRVDNLKKEVTREDNRTFVTNYDKDGKCVAKLLLENGKRIEGDDIEFILYDWEGSTPGYTKVSYENGKKTSEKTYIKGVMRREVPFKNGRKDGIEKWYDEKGKFLGQNLYVNDFPEDGIYKNYHKGYLTYTIPYKNGKRDGVKVVYRSNGDIQEKMDFKDDKQNGMYRRFDEKGILTLSRMYKDGKADGAELYYDENRNILARNFYKDNEPVDGIHKRYMKDYLGRFFLAEETCYRDGQRYGVERSYRMFETDHLLESETYYRNGKKDGLERTFDSDGNLLEEKDYKNDYLDGAYRTYDKNHNLVSEQYYRDNLLDGEERTYDKKGNIKCITNWKRGKKDGLSIEYTAQGKKETMYKNGKEVVENEINTAVAHNVTSSSR